MQERTVRVMPGQFPPHAFHPAIACKRQIAPGYFGQLIVNQLGDALTKHHIVANEFVEVLTRHIVVLMLVLKPTALPERCLDRPDRHPPHIWR